MTLRNKEGLAEGDVTAKDHPFREAKTNNRLEVTFISPFNEAIIDENRIESALRNAFGVPDLEVKTVKYELQSIL